MNNVLGKQIFTESPRLSALFDRDDFISKKVRNERIRDAFDRHGHTLREIGDYLDLHPNYISSLLGKMRKT